MIQLLQIEWNGLVSVSMNQATPLGGRHVSKFEAAGSETGVLNDGLGVHF